LLVACQQEHGVRVFRPAVLRLVIEALEDVLRGNCATLAEAGAAARERTRHHPRPIPRRGIGSTLLLKGLECDHVVLLDADRLTSKDLYVALSRAKRSVTVCSASLTIACDA